MEYIAMPPLGLAHFSVIQVPPLELVGLAASTGYSSIGLRLHPAFPGAPFYEVRAGSTTSTQMRQRLGDAGIRVYDIEFVTVGPDFVPASLARILEDASALGARRLSVCGDDADRGRLIANFAALCGLADQFGMGVDLECMAWRRVASIDAALEVVLCAAQPNAGLLIDALHLARTGGTPHDLRRIPAPFMRSAQLCDAGARVPATHDAMIQEARSGRLPPGQGTLPLRELIAELPCGTTLSVEVPMKESDDAFAHALANIQAAEKVLRAAADQPQSQRSV
jgi:sugar phosphate isomerase/epimerase